LQCYDNYTKAEKLIKLTNPSPSFFSKRKPPLRLRRENGPSPFSRFLFYSRYLAIFAVETKVPLAFDKKVASLFKLTIFLLHYSIYYAKIVAMELNYEA
jgi:hypothetical protein